MYLDKTHEATYTSECLLLKISMKYNFWANFLHFAAAALPGGKVSPILISWLCNNQNR